MRKFLLFSVFAFTFVSAFAQGEVGKWSLHPQIGVTLNQVNIGYMELLGSDYSVPTYGKVVQSAKIQGGVSAGLEVGYQLNSFFLLSGGLLYETLGVKWDNRQTDPSYSSYFNDCTTKETLGYVSVPILANFYVLKGLALKCGVKPMFNTSASGILEDQVRKMDISIPLGVSYELPMGLIFDARYNIGIKNVLDGDVNIKSGETLYRTSIGKLRNNTFTLTVGYKFDL